MYKLLRAEGSDEVKFIDLNEKLLKRKITSHKVWELMEMAAADRSFQISNEAYKFSQLENKKSKELIKEIMASNLTRTQVAKKAGISTKSLEKLLLSPLTLDDKFKYHAIRKIRKALKTNVG